MKKTMTVLALTLRRRTLSTRTLLALLALLIPIWASAQSHGAHCTTPGQGGYIYSFTTPTGDAPQVDFDLYFNSDHALFGLPVIDPAENAALLVTNSGYSTQDRFVHGSARLEPSTRYEIFVACYTASAHWRLSVRSGAEISVGEARRWSGIHRGLSAAEAAAALQREELTTELHEYWMQRTQNGGS